MTDEQRVALAKLKEVLEKHNMSITVDACGCCDSPYFTLTIDGVKVLELEEFKLDTSKPDFKLR